MTTRRYEPAAILLADIRNPATAFGETILKFVAPTPDARVSVRVSVVVLPDPSYWTFAFPDIFGIAFANGPRALYSALWLAAAVKSQGSNLTVTNLLGSEQTPTLIPDTAGAGFAVGGAAAVPYVHPTTSGPEVWAAGPTLVGWATTSGPGLLGFSQTVVADCDLVTGELHLGSPYGTMAGGTAPVASRWFLAMRYQAVVPLCDDEWSEIVSHCTPGLTGSPLVVT